MSIAVRREGIPRVAMVFALFLLLVGLLAAAVLLPGSRGRTPAPIVATNGLVAFESGDGDIVAVQPDGTGRRVLAGGAGEQASVSFSPDGRRMAFWSQTGAFWDLIVANADGSDPKAITSGVIEETGSYADWSPDGTSVAYSARTAKSATSYSCPGFGTQNGDFCSSRIFLAAVDGSGSHQIGDPGLDARSPAWSPDGSTIAFGGGNASPSIGVRLYLMNLDGTNVRPLSDVRGTDWAFEHIGWSHDGSKIAAQASAANDIAEWDIWVIKADGSGATDVGAHVGGDEIIPSWAPDRNALAWSSNGIGATVLEEGAKPVDVAPPGGLPTWSPDGKLLALIGGSNPATLRVTDLSGAVRFTIDGVTGHAAWQPLFSGG